jgi:hypothetical protein
VAEAAGGDGICGERAAVAGVLTGETEALIVAAGWVGDFSDM